MSHARYLVGDVFDRMAELPDGSVDLLMTSPPFLALRSYLPADHPDKGKEIGSEASPAAFLDTLLALTAEWRRLLAPHGSICVELGDTYSGSAGGGPVPEWGTIRGDSSISRREPEFRTSAKLGIDWPLAKSLCAIPQLYEASLAYGRNLLTGQPSPAGQWRVRNMVAWCRPNPPVGALGDKFRPATSYLTIACVSDRRYFDLDAVRTINPDGQGVGKPPGYRTGESATYPENGGNHTFPVATSNPAGAPPLDWWNIPTHPYPGSHYATFPPALCVRPILAMAPQRVCLVCGEPSRRVTDAFTLDSYRASDRPQTVRAVALADEAGLTDEHIAAVRAFGTSDAGKAVTLNNGAGKNSEAVKALAAQAKAVLGGYFREFVVSTTAERSSTWTDCGHDTWRNGMVLDPFAGSGTTLAVASGHGRDSIGIDIDPRNVALAEARIGMFLEVEEGTRPPGAKGGKVAGVEPVDVKDGLL